MEFKFNGEMIQNMFSRNKHYTGMVATDCLRNRNFRDLMPEKETKQEP